jgi:signal recognition particle receptor subunit beta
MDVFQLVREFLSGKGAADRFEHELHNLDNTEVKIALLGRSGTGKSSLMNALVGERVAASGAVETTTKAQEFNVNGLIFVDLPGGGTTRFPFDEYLDTMKINTYDAFILVVSKRILESDLDLLNELKSRTGKKIHVVRTMIDQDIENAVHDGISPELVLHRLRSDLESKFGSTHHCWLISNRHPKEYDFPAFSDSLLEDFDDARRDKYVFAVKAYTDGQLRRKREVAERHVTLFAGMAAVNGFNPVFGADIVADVAILVKMNQWILRCYKLDEEHMHKQLRRTPLSSAQVTLVNRLIAYGTKEFILSLLKRQVTRMTGKELAKWVPVVGHMASAGLGFALTRWMGHDLILQCEEATRSLMREVHSTPARTSKSKHPV